MARRRSSSLQGRAAGKELRAQTKDIGQDRCTIEDFSTQLYKRLARSPPV